MAYNAGRYTKVCGTEKANLQGLQVPQTLGEERRGSERSDRPSQPEPRACEAGEAYTVCYAKFDLPYYVQKRLEQKLRNTAWFVRVKPDGATSVMSGAVAGNKVYAYRRGNKMETLAARVLGGKPDHCTFTTLTSCYTKTEAGRQASWKNVRKELTVYIRQLRRKGVEDYLYVLEAHADGGCHVHLLCRWGKKVKTFEHKGKLRVTNAAVRQAHKDWNGEVDVQGVRSENVEKVKYYLCKELGKFGHCEAALKRAKRNWEKEGDEDKRKGDRKRLWTYYYADKLNIRLYGAGKAQKVELPSGEHSEPEKATDLINNMNKSTEPQEAVTLRLPQSITKNPNFEPYNGRVDANSWTYNAVWDFYEKATGQKRPKKE